MSRLAMLFLVGCYPASSATPVSIDRELAVAAAAVRAFVDDADTVRVLRVYHQLDAKTAGIADSAAWVAGVESTFFRQSPLGPLLGRYWSINQQARPWRGPLTIPGWDVEFVLRGEDMVARHETIHYVSRIAFTSGGDSALVSIDALCGMLCGHGTLSLFVSRDGDWQHARTLQFLQY